MSKPMRAAVTRIGGLDVVDVEEPAPGPGQVLVRTLACGICGSDLHAAADLRRFAATLDRPGRRGLAAEALVTGVVGLGAGNRATFIGAAGEAIRSAIERHRQESEEPAQPST
jgi:threonine dehydrogenase-like Zn-dependent dehydrogenase